MASPDDTPTAQQFRELWPVVTADSNLTLHGFRRFKTTHLLNLRFLECEIAKIDHAIYQAGLSLDFAPSSVDRLGLQHSRRDADVPAISETITDDLISRLRTLLKDYDDALVAFNAMMSMETMSLLDDGQQSSMRTDLTLHEKLETRLLRVDLGARSRTDPYQRWVHKRLRQFRFWSISRKAENNTEAQLSAEQGPRWSHQNTLLIASVVGRVVAAIMAGIFLVVPLAILSAIKGTQLAVVAVSILLFSFLVGTILNVSNYEMMVASAAYAAVLSVFVSNEAA